MGRQSPWCGGAVGPPSSNFTRNEATFHTFIRPIFYDHPKYINKMVQKKRSTYLYFFCFILFIYLFIYYADSFIIDLLITLMKGFKFAWLFVDVWIPLLFVVIILVRYLSFRRPLISINLKIGLHIRERMHFSLHVFFTMLSFFLRCYSNLIKKKFLSGWKGYPWPNKIVVRVIGQKILSVWDFQILRSLFSPSRIDLRTSKSKIKFL